MVVLKTFILISVIEPVGTELVLWWGWGCNLWTSDFSRWMDRIIALQLQNGVSELIFRTIDEMTITPISKISPISEKAPALTTSSDSTFKRCTGCFVRAYSAWFCLCCVWVLLALNRSMVLKTLLCVSPSSDNYRNGWLKITAKPLQWIFSSTYRFVHVASEPYTQGNFWSLHTNINHYRAFSSLNVRVKRRRHLGTMRMLCSRFTHTWANWTGLDRSDSRPSTSKSCVSLKEWCDAWTELRKYRRRGKQSKRECQSIGGWWKRRLP